MSNLQPPALPASATLNPTFERAAITPWRAQTYLRRSLAVVGLSVAAAALTFTTGWGLNLPLLIGLAIAAVVYRRPGVLQNPSFRVQLLAVAGLGIATVAHLDPWTTTTLLLSALALLGSLWFAQGTDPMRGLAYGLVQVVSLPAAWYRAVRALSPAAQALGVPARVQWSKGLGPIAVFLACTGLYIASNAMLSQVTSEAMMWLASATTGRDTGTFLLWTLVWSVPAAAVIYVWRPASRVARLEVGDYPQAMPSTEHAGWSCTSLTLLGVNIAALVVNTLDGITTYRAGTAASTTELFRGVHAGTYTLITAIVLATGYLVATTRRPPADRSRARHLALAWLGQNLVMALTVCVRNWHYTEAYGLTYRRLGVWAFLICAAAGLVLLGREVQLRRGLADLIRRQTWACYAVLTLAALPNWPGLITRFNLSHERTNLDQAYLRTLRPYNLDVWAEYDPFVLCDPNWSTYCDQQTGSWTAPPSGWREWDYRQWRRARAAER